VDELILWLASRAADVDFVVRSRRLVRGDRGKSGDYIMKSAMATTLVSISDYLATTYRPDAEYIDGVIVERNLGEYDHSSLQAALILFFGARQREWNIRVLPEQRIQVAPTRFRIPDVAVFDRAQPIEPVFTGPPLVVIEILSKDDTLRAYVERVTDYLDFGAANMWIIDPGTRRAWVADRSGFQERAVLEVANSPIRLPLAELFAELE
jgi:Uma2 family endonuclease